MSQQEQVQDFIEHLSERPWSDYTAADYSVEQWHNACLIHQHEGAPTSKSQCKLPVKTPNGAVNRNAVHSAAAALAGARGGVHASSDEKASAAKALVRYYHQMDEKPPPSLLAHTNVPTKHMTAEEYVEHVGVKGMKWGVRKGKSGKKGSGKTSYKKTPNRLSDAELSKRIKRMEMEKKYRDLNAPDRSAGRDYARGLLENAGRTAAGAVVGAAATFFIQRELRSRFGAAG